MKKWLAGLLALLLIAAGALAEEANSAREYAQWLESALPGAAFEDAELTAPCVEALSEAYDFVGRSDAVYGSYICGVRRVSADAKWRVETEFSPDGIEETLLDENGEERFRFSVDDLVQVSFTEDCRALVIPMENSNGEVLLAKSPGGRAQLAWRAEKGFDAEDLSRPQLVVEVHNLDSWTVGVTNQPTGFCLNVDEPGDLLGEESLPRAEASEKFAMIPIGAYLRQPDGSYWELVLSAEGQEGVLVEDRLYLAGPGFDRLLDRAEAVLGYRPGDMDFTEKQSVRTVCRWQAGSVRVDNGGEERQQAWDAGELVLTDAEKLRALDAMLAGADFTVGSVNCPSSFFLTLEYADGSSASLAVAVNSFDLFFYRGVLFEIDDAEAFMRLLDLKNSEFYRANYLMGADTKNGTVRRVVNCQSYISLREAPSVKSDRLAKIPLGAYVTSFGSNGDGMEYVCYDGQYGYALSKYLADDFQYDGSEDVEKFPFEGEISDAILLKEGTVSVYEEPAEGAKEIGKISAPCIVIMGEAYGAPSENSSAENPWGTEGYSRVEWWDSAANEMRSGCIKDSELSECTVSPSTQWDYAVTGYIGKTTEENAELRGGPQNDAIPTAALKKGSHLYVLGSAEGDWLYVSDYPFSSYLDDERSQEEHEEGWIQKSALEIVGKW